MDIIQERLEREFKAELIATAPSVVYEVQTTDGKIFKIDNPSKMPPPGKLAEIKEPFVKMDIHVPHEYVGNVLTLCEEKKGNTKGY